MEEIKSLQPVVVRPEVLKNYGNKNPQRIPIAFDKFGLLTNGKVRRLPPKCNYIPSENSYFPDDQVDEAIPILTCQRISTIEIASESATIAIADVLKPKIKSVVEKYNDGEGEGMLFEGYVINEGKGNYVYKTSTQSIPFKNCFVSLDKDAFERNYSKLNEIAEFTKTSKSSGRQTRNSRKSLCLMSETSTSVAREKRKRTLSLVDISNSYSTTPRIPREGQRFKNLLRRKLKTEIVTTVCLNTSFEKSLDTSPENSLADPEKHVPINEIHKATHDIDNGEINSECSIDSSQRKITDYFKKHDSHKKTVSLEKQNLQNHLLQPQENNTTQITHLRPTSCEQAQDNLETNLSLTESVESSNEDIEIGNFGNHFSIINNINVVQDKADEFDFTSLIDLFPLEIVSSPYAHLRKALRKYYSIYNSDTESLYFSHLNSNEDLTKPLRSIQSYFVASKPNITVRVVTDPPVKKQEQIEEYNPFVLLQKDASELLYSNVLENIGSVIEDNYSEESAQSMISNLEKDLPTFEEVASFALKMFDTYCNFKECSFSIYLNQLQQKLAMLTDKSPLEQPKYVSWPLENVLGQSEGASGLQKNYPVQLDLGGSQMNPRFFEFKDLASPILNPSDEPTVPELPDCIFEDIVSMEEDMSLDIREIYENRLKACWQQQFYKEIEMVLSLERLQVWIGQSDILMLAKNV